MKFLVLFFFLGLILFSSNNIIIDAAVTPSPTPTPLAPVVKQFLVMCDGTSWQDSVYLSRLHYLGDWTILFTGPNPVCVFGTIETITISP